MRTTQVLRGLVAAVVVGMLSGCLPSSPQKIEAIPLPLSGEEVKSRLAGNSVYRKGMRGLARWQYASHHSADGALSAKTWWLGGADVAQGHWEVSEDGTYCRRWFNHWANGEEGCFRVFASSTNGSLIFDHVSGNAGDSKRYDYQVLVGNPYSL